MRRSLLVLLAACGGTASHQPAAVAPAAGAPVAAGGDAGAATVPPPELLGLPVWDGPLADPMARRALDRAHAALADAPPNLEGADPRMWLGPVQTWVERRAALARELRADAEALDSDDDPRLQLLAAIVVGVSGDDLVSDLLALELPPEAAAGEFQAEAQQTFHDALEARAAPLATATRPALQRCAALAPRAPQALRGWEALCRDRDVRLAELEARVAARGAAQ